jgi:hypothetical protein
MRYFADAPLALDQIKSGLKAANPAFKIDGGEVQYDGEVLGEMEITRPGSDMFADEIAGILQRLAQTRAQATQAVMSRVQATQSVLGFQVMDGQRAPAATMELLGPFWSVVQGLANGLWQIEGQGFYEGGQLLVQV